MATETVETTNEKTEIHAEPEETHEHPRGALLITIFYLLLLTFLWIQVYMQLLNEGGIARP